MDAVEALPAPAALDDAQAASFHIAYQTGWFGLHRRAGLQAGETLLVHAAAGGVGSAAVQLGKAAGARVIGVVGGPAKASVAADLGADIVIDRRADDFVAAVKDATGGRGADVIYDPVGGDAFARSTKCIAFEGRLLVIGFASGDIPSAADEPRADQELLDRRSALGPLQTLRSEVHCGRACGAVRARRRRRRGAAGERGRAVRRGTDGPGETGRR